MGFFSDDDYIIISIGVLLDYFLANTRQWNPRWNLR